MSAKPKQPPPKATAKFTASCLECQHPMSAVTLVGLDDAMRDHQSWHQAPELFKDVVRAGNP